jgi:hypothetical protein
VGFKSKTGPISTKGEIRLIEALPRPGYTTPRLPYAVSCVSGISTYETEEAG